MVSELAESKKSKRKRMVSEPAADHSAGDQIVTGEDKKRKKEHSVVLEESSQIDSTKTGDNRESKKKGGKKIDKVGSDLCKNASAGGEEIDLDGTNHKKENKSKEIGGGKREKEKAAHSKEKAARSEDKGKRVSFAESKKSKRKHMVSEPAADHSAGDQIVTGEDKKRKKEHSVVLEESSQIDNTKTGDNRESKKKRGKKIDKVSSDLCKNASAGGEEIDIDGTNHKKENKSKEIGGGKREKEKAAHSKEKTARSKDKGKRVSFADAAEVFTIEGGDDEEGGSSGESKLVHGQRFTPEEDETLMEAIRNYAEMKQLGEKGLEMIRSCKKHPELKGCWNDIVKALPHRPYMSIYKRAHILLYRSDERKWTEEEKEKIRRFVEKNGTDWKTLAEELGKSDIHVKDTWRRIKPKNLRKGSWTQEEHQNLFDLVNLDLRVKSRQENNPTHRRLRENISWEAISDKLTTRNHKNCCLKWYNTLASPLVKQGIWADIDDYLLVEALQKDDAVCIEDVNWDSLLDHRSGEVCRQRWNQMVRSIGGHREKPFIEQVEVLSKRYCREMADYRK